MGVLAESDTRPLKMSLHPSYDFPGSQSRDVLVGSHVTCLVM